MAVLASPIVYHVSHLTNLISKVFYRWSAVAKLLRLKGLLLKKVKNRITI